MLTVFIPQASASQIGYERDRRRSPTRRLEREKGLGWGVQSLQTGPEGEGPQPQETPLLEQREAPLSGEERQRETEEISEWRAH